MRWREQDPFTVAATVRAALGETRRELELRCFAALLVLSSTADSDNHDPIRVWTSTIGMVAEAERGTRRDRMFDHAATVTIMRCPDDPDHLYGVVYAEQAALRDAVLATGEPYPYWDNTDRPDDVDETEWELRAGRWEACTAAQGTAADTSLTVRVDHNDAWAGWTLGQPDDRTLLAEAVERAAALSPTPAGDIATILGPFAPAD